MKTSFRAIALAVIATLIGSIFVLGSAVSASAAVTAYSTPHLDAQSNYTATPAVSSTISITVDGTTVPVVDTLSQSLARFAMSGPATVVITVSSGVSSATVRPQAFGINAVLTGTTVTFTLDQPRKLAIDINGTRDRLILFADPAEVSPPTLSDANVKNVMDFAGVSNTGAVSTTGLQAAIDWVSANHSTKNILYFPDGVYRTAMLNLENYVQIYFASGAVLIADGDITHYSTIAAPYSGQTNVSALLLMRNVHDVKIFGRGIINGNGYNIYAANAFAVKIETLYSDQGTHNVEIDDVLVTNSVYYQTHFAASHSIDLTNVKLHNPLGGAASHINDDGYKVNASYDMSFVDGWIQSRDDNITTAACCGTEATQNTRDVKIDNVVLNGNGYPAASVRFAYTDYGYNVRDVTMSNIYDIGGTRSTAWLIQPSGTDYHYRVNWGGILLENWFIERSGNFLTWSIGANDTPVTISDMVLRNIQISGTTSGNVISGSSTRTFDNVQFNDLRIGGQLVTTAAQAGLTVGSGATNVAFTSDNIAPAATATTTSLRPGDTAAAGSDGNVSTFFKSAASPTYPQYFTLVSPHGQRVSQVTYVCDHCQGQGLKNWDVQVSADGSTGWTTVASSGDVKWNYITSAYENKTLAFPAVSNVKGVRLKINSAYNAYGQYQVDEVEVADFNLALSATASTSSIRAGDSASTANDNDWATFFKSAMSPSYPQYLTLTWPTGQSLQAVDYVCDYCQGQGLKNWEIQTSADGSSGWTTVASSGDVSWTLNNGTREVKTLSFPLVTGQKGMRLKINSAYNAYGQYQVDEVETR